jgi:hypothetical protein
LALTSSSCATSFVDQRQVGLRLAQHGQRLLAVARLDDALDVGQARQQRPDPGAHQRMVVCQ